MQKSEVICDRCRVEITDWDIKQSSAKIHLWGIGAHRSMNPQRIDLCEKADKLAAELEAAKSEPVQESIVYVEKEAEQIDKPAEGGKAAKLEEELKAVQEKLAEAEQRAAAVEHKADMRVQAVNFALREIAGKVADIGGAIDEIEQGGDGELAGKLRVSAAKAIKAMLEGAKWYGKI